MPKRNDRDAIKFNLPGLLDELTWNAQTYQRLRLSYAAGEYVIAGTNIGYRVRLTATRYTVKK